ncbi:hypothetical protein [Vreelandella indica]|uniref:hypothetical protein n=1 Tax=Vreelandella indica TaxID=3126500 RepID=UPI00300E415A
MNAGALAPGDATSISTNIIRGVATQSRVFHGLTIQDLAIPDPTIPDLAILGLTIPDLTIPGPATPDQIIPSLNIRAMAIRALTDMTNVLVGSVMV